MRAALVCLSCFVAWGFGFCHTGLWARPRPGALGGALVMPRKSGPGLCFLPRNSPGWPWNPAYSQVPVLPVALPGAGVSTRWHLLLGDGGSTHSASQTTTPSFSLPSSYARRVQRIITFFLRPAASAFLPHARPLGLVVDPLPKALLGRTNLTTTLSAPSVLATPLPTPRAPFQLQRTCLGWGSIKHG